MTAKLPLLVAAAALATACVPPPPAATFEAAKGPPLAATDARSVQLLPTDALPDGISVRGLDVEVDPSVPSLDEPHRVVGEVRVRFDQRHTREQYVAEMRSEAARHGANALLVLDETGDRCYSPTGHKCRLGAAIRLSARPPEKLASAEAALREWLASHAAAGQPDGAPHEVDLAQLSAFEIAPARGECLTVVLALDATARSRRVNGSAVTSVRSTSPAPEFNRLARRPPEWGGRQRTLDVELGCSQGGEKVRVEVRSGLDRDDDAPGTGRAIVQLVKRRMGEAELKERGARMAAAFKKAEEDARVAAAEMRAAEQRRASERQERACDACIGEWRRCVMRNPDIRRGECASFNACVSRHFADPKLCNAR